MAHAPVNRLSLETKDDDANTRFRQPFERPSGITARVVSQISVTGIDLYCNWVLEILASGFKLSLRGQQNINSALNNLPAFKTADEKLQFGWVSDHALKNLGVHVELYERLALEVALSETFPERYAAKVLWEMTRSYATEQDVIPHFQDMVRIVHSSNGLFTATNFSLTVEGFLRMLPDPGSGTAADQGLPVPRDMAVALSMLAEVTNDHHKQLTVIGGRLLAWFAAAAEWLYDLTVAIYLPSGERLHSNHDGKKSQLLLVFNPGPELKPALGSLTDDAARALEAATGSISLSAKKVLSNVPFGGRAEWNSLLAQVFGSSFLHLEREETRTFGTVLGASARAQQFIHEIDPQRSNQTLRPVGPALIQLLTDWMPELRRLQSRMERQLKLTAEESRKTYAESLEALGKVCGCALCGPRKSPVTHNSASASFDYCLIVLVETVVVLGMVLSRLTVAPHIFPTAHGLRNLYRRQYDKQKRALETNRGVPLAIAEQVYSEEATASGLRRMQNCAELFSGSRPVDDLPENLVALSHEGICVYLVSIEKTDQHSRQQDQDLLRVTSGGVGVRFKIFNRAALGPVAEADELDNVWEEVNCSHLTQPLYCK